MLDDAITNVLWPLPGNKCRWTFQMRRSEAEDEFPEKERRAVRTLPPFSTKCLPSKNGSE